MKTIKTFLTILLGITASTSLWAQKEYDPSYWRVDWRPDRGTRYEQITARQLRRYSLAIHPAHLMKEGLKLDFEMELPEPGRWLQASLMGYSASKNGTDQWGNDYPNWGNLASGFEEFAGMWGVGAGIGYKTMFSHRGFYFNAALLYNYYSVDHDATYYLPTIRQDLTYYERKHVVENSRFHQPALSLNVGKHIAFSRNLFMDVFIGTGCMHSIYNGPQVYTDYAAFGYRGAYFNMGLRFGVLWSDRK